jgi:hypothetical protein
MHNKHTNKQAGNINPSMRVIPQFSKPLIAPPLCSLPDPQECRPNLNPSHETPTHEAETSKLIFWRSCLSRHAHLHLH